jgi:hypothetical protein
LLPIGPDNAYFVLGLKVCHSCLFFKDKHKKKVWELAEAAAASVSSQLAQHLALVFFFLDGFFAPLTFPQPSPGPAQVLLNLLASHMISIIPRSTSEVNLLANLV